MKCKVCGHEFELKKENKYIVKSHDFGIMSGETINLHECFDCPICGCQNPVNLRAENVVKGTKCSNTGEGMDTTEFAKMIKAQKLYCENT